MLNKIRYSFVFPQGLIAYRKDRLVKVFAYIFFFAIFMGTAPLINTITFTGIPRSTEDLIIENSVPLENSTCEIREATLVCDEVTHHQFLDAGRFTFSIDTRESIPVDDYRGFSQHVVMREDRVTIIFMGNVVLTRPIAELDEAIHTLDMRDDATASRDFYQAMFTALNTEIREARPIWGSLLVVGNIVSGLILFNIFIILNTLLTRMRLPQIGFRDMYVMMAYAGTLLYIILIFESLLNFNFFIFLLLLFVAFRQMSRLAFELQKQIMQQPPPDA